MNTSNTSNDNPLKKYFRSEKISTPLPSGKNRYPKDVLELPASGEVGVMAMTAKDEMTLKNPDALLNGDAIEKLLKSCIPAVKQVKSLEMTDVDTMLMAIKYATYGDNFDYTLDCPNCQHENKFRESIREILDTLKTVPDENIVHLDEIKVYVRPHTFELANKVNKLQFEQEKMRRILEESDIPDEEKLQSITPLFEKIAEMTGEMVCGCIERIQAPSDNGPVTVINPKHIKEFVQNLERKDANAIQEKAAKLNQLGINKTADVKCEKCGHEWQVQGREFNPVSFFE